MNKRILSAIAIGSLSTLCSAMLNPMQQREQQLKQQQEQRANGIWAQQYINQGVPVPANISYNVDPFVHQQIYQHHQKLAQQNQKLAQQKK